MRKVVHLLLLLGLGIAAMAATQSQAQNRDNSGGAIFVMTNNASRSEIISYKEIWDGTLSESREFLTGGRGSGGTTDPLPSQGSLTLSLHPRGEHGCASASSKESLLAGQMRRYELQLADGESLPDHIVRQERKDSERLRSRLRRLATLLGLVACARVEA